MLYKHYNDYKGPWPYENFSKHEVSCKHCGEFYHDPAMMDKLQRLRDLWGQPIVINSGHRCRAHNANVGGAAASSHLQLAFDCHCLKDKQAEFIRLARRCGFTGIGRYAGFVHIDTGRSREWTG